MYCTNSVLKISSGEPGLNISLSTYKGSSVYYRAGDTSLDNLEPSFVDISKKNKAAVKETSSKNNIINGKVIE